MTARAWGPNMRVLAVWEVALGEEKERHSSATPGESVAGMALTVKLESGREASG